MLTNAFRLCPIRWLRSLGLALASALLLATCQAAASTNLVDDILSQARFPVPEKSRFAAADIRFALDSSTLLVKASVVDSNATVRASTNQHEVSPDQGWVAISVHAEAVLKGTLELRDIMIANQYPGFQIDGSPFPMRYRFTNGETCFFFLKPDRKLSRWCATNVFENVKIVPVK